MSYLLVGLVLIAAYLGATALFAALVWKHYSAKGGTNAALKMTALALLAVFIGTKVYGFILASVVMSSMTLLASPLGWLVAADAWWDMASWFVVFAAIALGVTRLVRAAQPKQAHAPLPQWPAYMRPMVQHPQSLPAQWSDPITEPIPVQHPGQ